jgi:hypothetical protein
MLMQSWTERRLEHDEALITRAHDVPNAPNVLDVPSRRLLAREAATIP